MEQTSNEIFSEIGSSLKNDTNSLTISVANVLNKCFVSFELKSACSR